MPYCSGCAVEVASHHRRCPLCGGDLTDRCPDPPAAGPTLQHAQQRPPLPWPVWRRRCYSLITAVLMVPLLVTVFVDLADGRPTWSWVAMQSLVATWLMLGISLYWITHPAAWWTGQALVVAGLLIGLDGVTDGRWSWSLRWGLPLVALVAVCLGGVTVWIVHRRPGVFLAAALVCLAVSSLCVGIDVVVDWASQETPAPSWSLRPLGLLGLVAFLCVYIHVRWARHTDLKRWFHL